MRIRVNAKIGHSAKHVRDLQPKNMIVKVGPKVSTSSDLSAAAHPVVLAAN